MIRGVQEAAVFGKRVLVRVDFNVPLEGNVVVDDTRIRLSLKTIEDLIERGARIILMSHLGRPKGQKNNKYSLYPVAKKLETLINRPVHFVEDCIGDEVKQAVAKLEPKDILLLENLRFYPAEEKPDLDPLFAEELASFGDLYVCDAFGSAHRKHSSITEVPKYFPNKVFAGYLLQKEVSFLGDVLNKPLHPFYAIIGGAKVSSKIGVLESLIPIVDGLIIGGAMANTFLLAQGLDIGDSLCEKDFVDKAKEIIKTCQKKGVDLLLPIDVVIADKIDQPSIIKTVSVEDKIGKGFSICDIGDMSLLAIEGHIKNAQLILWNGPLGIFENQPFDKATTKLAFLLASMQAMTIVGGGDSVAAINKTGLSDKMSHISTGGGASLEFLEYKTLPGIEALQQ